MRRRLAFAASTLSFVILLSLVIWQGSFSFSYTPADLRETLVLWAVSILIFLLMVTLAFMIIRASVKLYIERQNNKEGSRIRSRLFVGAMGLALTPVLFSVFFSVYVLNRTLDKWFTLPARNIQMNLQEFDRAYKDETRDRAASEVSWIASLPEARHAAQTGEAAPAIFADICKAHSIEQLSLTRADGKMLMLCQAPPGPKRFLYTASANVLDGSAGLGRMTAALALKLDLSTNENTIKQLIKDQDELSLRKKTVRNNFIGLDILIGLFVLFFAMWLAQIMSRQISAPILALLEAAREVRQGNLSYRIRVNAIDELVTLVRVFNEMTNDLETNAHELEARRRFTEAILESIPTGVISVSSGERIERVNRAMFGIFPRESLTAADRLEDLFAAEDLAEIRYLMKRARRTGAAGCQMEVHRSKSLLHLAVTVASLEERRGFVIVLEDTSDLLRAQKSAAWQEVARRIAHEIKNPLTPISLCADRIGRQLLRVSIPDETRAILEECTQTIQREVQTVKTLVDEFAQFSRFPAAQPVPADLNEIVHSAIAVFAGRLEGIDLSCECDSRIAPVLADREQIKRVIVNLIDNAAEAMTDSPVRKLLVTTFQTTPDTVQLVVSDTGCGVSAEDKEKLFLPYFSTKNRGTGLGLAIVSHIVNEHKGRVRVDDNSPRGTQFVVELNTVPGPESLENRESIPATLRV